MNKRKKNKKIKNRHWPFIALPFAFSFLFSFILFYSIARSEEREKKSGSTQQQNDYNMCLLVFE